ncbi:sensor histidine kinase inhibitor, KipI family [Modicisalibacter ilicicola DSM 19980]|uniref:Sensor histidine kinase inhibitor, KipI family n=1 Tax=Modicisalibacter ilicicola DSM 19980 TaxID=1121942 RepID=A0A1M5CNP9_9GAMM|nr:allophanate hydrolase subunit 1 [Halomonas ilicicola]SHF56340.1 sensor histidine kinase inhibitor, KipI family [Halomonas ilicicola DSM 19980]
MSGQRGEKAFVPVLPRLEVAGVDAWMVRLFDRIDEANMPWITALLRRCEAAFGEALVDLVPSYTTLLVHYDPWRLTPGEARSRLGAVLADLEPDEEGGLGEGASGNVKELEVWYDDSVGPELALLQQESGLSREAVIEAHSGHEYRVFALGFAPGFAFMGSLPDELVLPRLDTPRKRVPAGSVAVANRQTSAYPRVSPGGWNLIGRTSARLFDRDREGFSLLRVGDRVRFVAVDRDRFEAAGGDTSPVEEPDSKGKTSNGKSA